MLHQVVEFQVKYFGSFSHRLRVFKEKSKGKEWVFFFFFTIVMWVVINNARK